MNAAHQNPEAWRGPTHRPLAYCCSRFRAADELEAGWNRAVAAALTRYVALHGWVPITPHLYLPVALDDGNAAEREIGLACGLSLVRRADVFFCYRADDVSEGMGAELALAGEMGLTIHFIDSPMELGLSPVDSGQLTMDNGGVARGDGEELTTEGTEREASLVDSGQLIVDPPAADASRGEALSGKPFVPIHEFWEVCEIALTHYPEYGPADQEPATWPDAWPIWDALTVVGDYLFGEMGNAYLYAISTGHIEHWETGALQFGERAGAGEEDRTTEGTEGTEKEVAGFDPESALIAEGRAHG